MNDSTLTDLYINVLREHHFSITGHADIEEEVHSFLEKLSKAKFFKEDSTVPFTFLMGGVMQILDKDLWELKNFDSFYCNVFNHADKAEVLSFYSFLNYHGKKEKEITSKVLSKLFGQDIDFHLSVKEIDEPECEFDEKNKVFKIIMPDVVIEKNLRKNHKRYKEAFWKHFEDLFKDGEEHLIAFEKKPKGRKNVIYINEKIVEENVVVKKYVELYELLFDGKQVDECKKKLFKALCHQKDKQNRHLFIQGAQINNLLNELTISAIALTFLCVYLESSIEYLMSVGKVEETNGEKIYRNIGGLIVGYKNTHQLPPDERIRLNLISDRLTAIVASDWQNTKYNEKTNRENTVATWKEKEVQNGTKRADQYMKCVNSKNWISFEKSVSDKTNLLWNGYCNDPNKCVHDKTNKNAKPWIEIETSDRAELLDFLVVRRFMAAIKEQGRTESDAYNFLVRGTHGGQINKFRNDHCFKKKIYSLLPEEENWMVGKNKFPDSV